MVLVELNKADHEVLANVFAREKRVAVQNMDAYQALKAYLPPAERRGLVLIDSSFDVAREFDRLAKALKATYARFATGVYAVWYPLMEPAAMRDFLGSIQRSGIRKVLRIEIVVRERDESGIIPGCGMLVVNPPFGFDTEAQSVLDWLWPILNEDGAGGVRLRWLVPE